MIAGMIFFLKRQLTDNKAILINFFLLSSILMVTFQLKDDPNWGSPYPYHSLLLRKKIGFCNILSFLWHLEFRANVSRSASAFSSHQQKQALGNSGLQIQTLGRKHRLGFFYWGSSVFPELPEWEAEPLQPFSASVCKIARLSDDFSCHVQAHFSCSPSVVTNHLLSLAVTL